MSLPKPPENLLCSIDETQLFSVLHWDKVTEDVDNNSTTILNYKVYRTKKSNQRDYELVATIITTDIDGDIDTILIDSEVDLIFNNYYKVTATNADGESQASAIIFDLIKLDFRNG